VACAAADRAPVAGPLSAESRLEELAVLYHKRLVTDDEYYAQRQMSLKGL
jgi:hypothetical protein